MERDKAVKVLTSAFAALRECSAGQQGPFVLANPQGSIHGKQRLAIIEDVVANYDLVMALTQVSMKWAAPPIVQEAIDALGHNDPFFGRSVCRLLSKVKDHVRRELQPRNKRFAELMKAVENMESDEEAEEAWYMQEIEDETDGDASSSVAAIGQEEAAHWLQRARLMDLHITEDITIVVEDDDVDPPEAHDDRQEETLEDGLSRLMGDGVEAQQERAETLDAESATCRELNDALANIGPVGRSLKRKLAEEEEPPVVSTRALQDMRAKKLEQDQIAADADVTEDKCDL